MKIITEQLYLKLLVYGWAGTGKTRFSASAALEPETAPVLYLNLGGNPLSMRDYTPQPKVVEIESLVDFGHIYKWLYAGQPAGNTHTFLGSPPKFNTVVIDTITDVQRLFIDKVLGTAPGSPEVIPTKMERAHFGSVLAAMTNFVNLWFKLPMHVIITAQEQSKTDELSAETHGPLILGQAEREVCGYAYAVLRMQQAGALDARTKKQLESKGAYENVAWLKQTGRFQAKDQYGTGVPVILDPTITKLYNLIKGSKNVK